MALQTISKEELKEKIDRGERCKIIDVRSYSSYWNGHIRGARNLPIDRFVDKAVEVLSPGEMIILYGEDDKDEMPERAAELLFQREFDPSMIYLFPEGILEWRSSGYFVEAGDDPVR